MALDGIFIRSIVKELKPILINSKIEKINQPEKDELIFSFRGNKQNKKLLISASSNYPRIHFTEHSKTNPMQPPMFCMLLRKYLQGAILKDIYQLGNDRIVKLEFEALDDLGFNSIYYLVVEIMGRHSNITLIRERDNIIMDSIKHLTPDINTYRILLPGVKYKLPPASTKLNPFSYSFQDFTNTIHQYEIELNNSFFSNAFTGISKLLSKELFKKFTLIKDIENTSYEEIYAFINSFFKDYLDNQEEFVNFYENQDVKEFYCLNLDTLHNLEKKFFNTASELLDDFYYKKDKQDRLRNKGLDVQKILNNNIDRCNKKMTILNNSLQESEGKEELRLKGELLTAYIFEAKKGLRGIEVYNYYSADNEKIYIELDETLTPSQNIQYYYKRYNKYKKSEEIALEQIKETEEELSYLNSVLASLENADSYEEIEEIRKELIDTGYIRNRRNDKVKNKVSKPHHFISSDGIDIYVGKNNLQNDYLTLKFADKSDIWLHTKNIPGSHVIIKGKNIPSRTLEEAAILAAFYSKAKSSSKVPVDYTEVKNVKKPSGARPGMVIYNTNKTIYVDPYDVALEKAK